MHVTHFRFRAKPGERQKVLDVIEDWLRQRPNVQGWQRTLTVANLNDPDEFLISTEFDSKELYDANSNHADTNAWYQQLRSHLVSDPDWFDAKVERDDRP